MTTAVDRLQTNPVDGNQDRVAVNQGAAENEGGIANKVGFYLGHAVHLMGDACSNAGNNIVKVYMSSKDLLEYLSKWTKFAGKQVDYREKVDGIRGSETTSSFLKATKVLGPLQFGFALEDLDKDCNNVRTAATTAEKVKAVFNGVVHLGDVCDYTSTTVDLAKEAFPSFGLVFLSEKIALIFQFSQKFIIANSERIVSVAKIISVKVVLFQEVVKHWGFTNSFILLGLKVRTVYETWQKEKELDAVLSSLKRATIANKRDRNGPLCTSIKNIFADKKTWKKLLSLPDDSKFEKLLDAYIHKFEDGSITDKEVHQAEAILSVLKKRFSTEYTFLAIDLANKVSGIVANVLKMSGVGIPVAYGIFVINATISLVVWHRKPLAQDPFHMSVREEGDIDHYNANRRPPAPPAAPQPVKEAVAEVAQPTVVPSSSAENRSPAPVHEAEEERVAVAPEAQPAPRVEQQPVVVRGRTMYPRKCKNVRR